MKRLLSSLGLVLCLLFAACKKKAGLEEPKPEKEEATPVAVQQVEPQTFVERVRYYGTARGFHEAELISHAGGRVNRLKVKDGDYVKQGQSLCDIEAEKYGNLHEAAKIQESLAKQEWERAKQHLEAGTYSQTQVDKAHQAYLNAQFQVMEAQKNWEGALCLSPITGTVLSHSVDLYQVIPPGSKTFQIANLSKIKIRLDVPEKDIEGFERGNKVRVPVDTQSLSGTVYSVSQQLDKAKKTFTIEVHVSNPGAKLKPGQLVSVHMEKRVWEKALLVPNRTVMNLEDGNYLMIVENGKAKRIPIERGPADSQHSLITSGLSAGDSLIIGGFNLVSNGAPVVVSENKKAVP